MFRLKRVPKRVLRVRPTPLCEEPGFHEGAQSRANEDLKLYLEEYQGERRGFLIMIILYNLKDSVSLMNSFN